MTWSRGHGYLARMYVGLTMFLRLSHAYAEGLSASVEPDYTYSTTRSSDATGAITTSSTTEVAQHYRLGLDESLFPRLRLLGFGLLEKTLDWTTTAGSTTRSDDLRKNLSAHLSLTPDLLAAEVGYDRREESSGVSTSSIRTDLVNEVYSAHAGWRPTGLPALDVTLSRTNQFDPPHRVQDDSTDTAIVSASYSDVKQLDLRYTIEYSDADIRLSETETTALTNTARATYTDSFDAGRTSLFAAYLVQNQVESTTVNGANGTVSTQQFPFAGLSLVENTTTLPVSDTLNPNPALIDNNTAVSASLDIGFAPSFSGDNNLRDVGVQFVDALTKVNTIYLWVDRQLPLNVSSRYSFSVYQSDDNGRWTPINVTAPVVFGIFLNRFEITIAQTQARYLKVVTQPLPATVTTDPRFTNVLVTEIQTYLVQPASALRGQFTSTTQTANATLHRQILAEPGLAYDGSAVYSVQQGGASYFLTNGLTLHQPLRPALDLTARVARQDSDVGAGHVGGFQYSASLAARPLPTLLHNLTYNGQWNHSTLGDAVQNAWTLLNRIALYRGVDVLAMMSYLINRDERGVTTEGPTVTANLALSPHPALAISGSYLFTEAVASGGGQAQTTSETERVDGNLTFQPFSALYVAAGLSRLIKGVLPTTLLNLGINFSPFPGGAVVLQSSYIQSLDTASNATSRLAGVSVRWNIRSGSYLDLGYALTDSNSSVQVLDTRSLTASLFLSI